MNQERINVVVKLSQNEIEQLMQTWQPKSVVLETQLIEVGYHHTNYLVKLANNMQAILRINPSENNDLTLERNLFTQLANKIAVPQVYFLQTDKTNFKYSYSIHQYLVGDTLWQLVNTPDRSAMPEAFYAVGAALAKLSAIRFTKAGVLLPDLTLQDSAPVYQFNNIYLLYTLDCLLSERALLRLGLANALRIKNFLYANGHLFPNEVNFLTHGDLRPDNILLQQTNHTWQVTGLVDWQFAGSGSFYFDIGTLLRFDDNYTQDEINAFKLGFEHESQLILPIEWVKIAKMVDLMRLIESLNADELTSEILNRALHLIYKTLDHFE